MSCSRCYDKFTLFKKEVGCGNCGFSFCSKCCSLKIVVPNRNNNKPVIVCKSCHEKLTNPSVNTEKPSNRIDSPPANLLKLREQNQIKSVATNRRPVSSSTVNKNLSPTHDIEERLRKLRETPNAAQKKILTVDEIESRLRDIQGVSAEDRNLSNLPNKPTVNTSHDLITQILDEVEVDKKKEELDKIELEKIEERRKNLSLGLPIPAQASDESKVGVESNDEDNHSDESNDERPSKSTESKTSKTKNIMKSLLDKAEKEYKKKVSIESDDNDDRDKDDEDLWCCICNGDANLKCIDCDKDYYCKRCFKETHVGFEYKSHRTKSI